MLLVFTKFSISAAEENHKVHLGQLKRFSLCELQVATDDFSNRNIIGRGGYCNVYIGRLVDSTSVAVKRLKAEHIQGGELTFLAEVEIISMVVHRNLLLLIGFCMTPTERILVYPYMANGSVASCLRGISYRILFVSSVMHVKGVFEIVFESVLSDNQDNQL